LLALLSPPGGHSPNADDINTLYWVMLVIGIVLLLAINGALIAFVMRFRSERGREPRRLVVRRPAQLGTAAVFALLALIVFVVGVVETHNAK
jgi:cytochrome c oxidase subunit 2